MLWCCLVCLLLHLLPRSVVVSLGEVWTPSPSPAPVSGQKLGLDFTIRLPPGGGRRKRLARAEYRGVAQTRVLLHLIRYAVLWLGSVHKKIKKTYPKETSFFYNNQP